MPDHPAVFPGGDEALQTFIKKNINYPEMAIVNNESGKVLIEFEVEKDGSITNIRVKKSVSPSLDQESLRMINLMPNWEAAKHDGISVRSTVVVPVIFRLG
jgi:protein TonB